jgi:mevalonate pyrophosphate decarboxylase
MPRIALTPGGHLTDASACASRHGPLVLVLQGSPSRSRVFTSMAAEMRSAMTRRSLAARAARQSQEGTNAIREATAEPPAFVQQRLAHRGDRDQTQLIL